MKKITLTSDEKKLVKRIKEYSTKEFTSDTYGWMHWNVLSEAEKKTAHNLSYKDVITLFPNRHDYIELK